MLQELANIASEKVKTAVLSAQVSLSLWKTEGQLRELKNIDGTDWVNLDAAKKLANHSTVIEAADKLESFNGSDEECLEFTKTVMGELSPAQQRALIMVQEERLKKIMSS